ncbi:MAG: hypothetical protein LBP59_11045 [Planctomycetaceae bacterium]|jgi:hypothetical protein|nr:hypothetical protein [Planctomycetaceae bacterium]
MQKSNNENVRVIVFLALVVVVIWCYNGWRLQYVQPKAESVLVSDTLYGEETHLANIRSIASKAVKEDRDRLSKFYKAFANVVQHDDRNLISNSSFIKDINSRAGVLCFGDDLMGKYPRLADEIDNYLRSSTGVDKTHKTMNKSDKQNVIKALNELSNLFKN